MSARLWVTGVGLVTPLGRGVDATWPRLVRGDRAFAPVSLFDGSAQRVPRVAEVSGVTVPVEPRGLWSRTAAMALEAAEEAARGAKLALGDGARRVGLVIGGTTAGMLETEELLARLLVEPERRAPPEMLSHPLTSVGDALELRLGPFAAVRSLASACSAGANALVVAAGWLLSGEVDAVLAGGADGLCRLTLSGFNALGAIDPEACRPFDQRRKGTTLGEGAGFVVLERAASARARGVEPIAELAGWALGAEAHHITNPAADGAVVGDLVRRAIARAGLERSQIDYVNAHGTATPANDAMEAAALAIGLGDAVERVPVSSCKGQIGHTLGAAGAIEAVATSLAIARRTLLPTAGLEIPDPAFRLVHVPGEGRVVPRVRAALSNAFGFGGMATVLAFTEPELSEPRHGGARKAVVTGVAAFGPGGMLGPDECSALPEQSSGAGAFTTAPPDRARRADPDPLLDAGRARRLDRMARLGAVAAERALDQAGADADAAGVVFGSAFGNVDGCAAFVQRLLAKGARAASPAEFPSLVPSSAVGHMSIYAGAHGPSFATADLAASGASAFAQAIDFVATGEARCIVAGTSEPESDLVARALTPLYARPGGGPRDPVVDLAVACVVEDASAVEARGARVLAQIEKHVEWRGAGGRSAVARLRAPRTRRVEVVAPHASAELRALLEGSAWAELPVLAPGPQLGESDALAGAALATAIGRLACGAIAEALVIATAPGRGYAFLLSAP